MVPRPPRLSVLLYRPSGRVAERGAGIRAESIRFGGGSADLGHIFLLGRLCGFAHQNGLAEEVGGGGGDVGGEWGRGLVNGVGDLTGCACAGPGAVVHEEACGFCGPMAERSGPFYVGGSAGDVCIRNPGSLNLRLGGPPGPRYGAIVRGAHAAPGPGAGTFRVRLCAGPGGKGRVVPQPFRAQIHRCCCRTSAAGRSTHRARWSGQEERRPGGAGCLLNRIGGSGRRDPSCY